MIKTILHNLGLNRVLDHPVETRRRHARRSGARAVITVGTRNYILRDWSPAGLFFDAEPGIFRDGESFRFTLKFRLEDGEIVEILHQAEVLRREPGGVAVRLKPYGGEIRRKFDRVLDSLVSGEFINSYVA